MKAVDLWNGDKGWDILSGPASGSGRAMSAQDFFVAVPWLYRAVKDRAVSLKKVAFAVVDEAGNDVDASATWQDELGLFPYPRRLLHQIEESMVMTGRAYLFLETNPYGYVKSVKYCLPTSIREKYDDNGDLLYYERAVKGRMERVEAVNIVAIYDPDYTVEHGPGASSAAKAAMLAAGVLFNTDQFIASYFARGAIKATVLSVDTADQKEANRFQAWWEDVIAGIKNAWTAFVLRGKSVTPVVIGEGLEGLQNTDLTTEKRQDVSTAIGVPESRMWSSAANYATAEVEDKKYFDDVIVPEAWTIEEALNAQLFTEEHHMAGYRWEFRPETNSGFSKDDQSRAAAYVSYVKDGGMLPSVAAQLVGIEMPGEMEYEDLDPEDEPTPEPVTVLPVNPPPALPAGNPMPEMEMPMDAQEKADLRRWQTKALKAIGKGGSAQVSFYSDCLPTDTMTRVRASLDACKSESDVRSAFAPLLGGRDEDYPDPLLELARQLKRANDLVEAV
jgi:hypothetical protein